MTVTLALTFWIVGCTMPSKAAQERAELHMRIGTGFLAQGQYPQAIGELIKAEQLDPKNPAILNNLGLAYHVMGRLKVAEQKFRRAIQYGTRFSDAKNNLARNLIDQNRPDEALKWLRDVEGDLTYPNPEKTYANFGMAYFQKSSYKKAEEYLIRSLDIRKDSCTATTYYGRTLQQLNRLNQAVEVLDRAIEHCRASKFEEPIFFSAMSYFSLGDSEKSRARLEELIKDYPQSKYVAKAKGMLQLLE